MLREKPSASEPNLGITPVGPDAMGDLASVPVDSLIEQLSGAGHSSPAPPPPPAAASLLCRLHRYDPGCVVGEHAHVFSRDAGSLATDFFSPANHELGFPGDLVCRDLVAASLSGDLCEPYDELAELEWFSNFVEESFSSEDLEKLQLISTSDRPPQGPVPGKARSKRSRAAPCSWSSRLLALSPPLMSTDSSSESEIFIPVANPVRKAPPLVSPRKKESAGPMMAPSDRRCLHCQTDKTPQWRTGPMGPKTLCNACGVRYKSGRLVPEYRPAASPTFVLSKHSNSHRKVLELRRQKEVVDHHHQYQHPHHPQYHHQQFLHGSVYDSPGQSAAGDDFLIHHHIGPDYRQLI